MTIEDYKERMSYFFQQNTPNEYCCCGYCKIIIFLVECIKKAAINQSISLKESLMEIECGDDLLKRLVFDRK